jgi:predicted nucleotidyltransferase
LPWRVGGDALAELDIAGILRALSDGEVDFFLIGGVAVGYHGHVRATKDVDVVPAPEMTNLERLADALARLDAQVDGAEEFSPAELPDPLDPEALATGGNWVLKTRLGRLDIMQWIGDHPLWEEMSTGAIDDEIAGIRMKIVDYDNLVRLKELAGRPEDLADLQRLREARGE